MLFATRNRGVSDYIKDVWTITVSILVGDIVSYMVSDYVGDYHCFDFIYISQIS